MFESLTVIIPASNETASLRKTAEAVFRSGAYDDIAKIIIFLKSEDCPSAETAKQLAEEFNCDKLEIVVQKSDNYRSAFTEIPYLVKSSHFIILVSDGEVDPATIEKLVPIAKEKPDSVVCGSKWLKGSAIKNPSYLRALGSQALNLLAAMLFHVKATDIFSIFQIYPLELYKKYKPSLSEYTLIPLRMGVEYIEIPTTFEREAGRKSNLNVLSFLMLGFGYTRSILKVRFTPKDKFKQS